MEKKLRVIQVGCGKMSKYIMKYIYDKGYEVVGAVDINKDIIGKDIGYIMESEDKNVKIFDVANLNELIVSEKPDIAIITTMSFLNDIEDVSRICLKNGVNVITTCEEAFYPENSNPLLYKELDTLAKANGCTMTGCGYQDVFWSKMITSICGSTNKITKIKGSSSYNVEDYGIALALAHGAGYSVEKFNKEIAVINNMSVDERTKLMNNREFFPSYMWNVVGSLAYELGLHVTEISQECIPVMCEDDMYSDTLKMNLEKGMVRGMNAIVRASTEENILFEIECIGKVYTKEEKDMNEWTIFGEPVTSVINTKPATVELTCADIVNRLMDVVKSESGYIPTCKMESPKYIVK